MKNSKRPILLSALTIIIILAFGNAPVFAGEVLQNRAYGYEIELPSEWMVDLSGSPDIVVCSIGEGGRFIIEAVPQEEDEWEKPLPDDTVAEAKASFEINFEDFRISDEGWAVDRSGLDTYDFNFECLVEEEPTLGSAKITFGHNVVLLVYYDDRRDFEYYFPDVQAAIESFTMDAALVEVSIPVEMPVESEALEFIDPMRSIYRNETFGYICENPGRLTVEEIGGPGWVVFSTGEGEVAIRYLDGYYGSGEAPEIFVTEMLEEIFTSFSRYEITNEAPVEFNDGRIGFLLDVSAVLNGVDWLGTFVGFESDAREPFIVSLLAPVEEFAENKGGFESLWRSLHFEEEF